ncbi:hypothetical protein KC19_9G086500 [Ceratodon purpureus]|uniref:Uncharacterized protein n=1 Tax=Ceratodon purpureus TaxID=3225 RepID=A0A8T0GTK5_CERPU|nr:hypothetical protein KC19_9G086500 [Ceratodon purpureus]
MEPAMEETGKGLSVPGGLSWRSRDTSWWTSAVDLSSTLISKMDQVPGSLVGFTLPWHAGGRADTKQPQVQTQPQMPASQRGAEFAGFRTEGYAGVNKPVELPKPKNEIAQALQVETRGSSEQVEEPNGTPNGAPNGEPKRVDSPKQTSEDKSCEEISTRSFSGPRVGESRRRTKRMPVDLAPEGPKQDSEAPIRSKRLSSVSQEFLLGQGPRMQSVESPQLVRTRDADSASIRRVDEASILSSRRSSGRYSSRSLCQGPLLEEKIKQNPPHVLPPPPGTDGVVHVTRDDMPEMFPGNTNRLVQLRVGNPNSKPSESHPSSRLSKDPVLGGSYRVAASSDAIASDARESTSLPTSPRLRDKESRASKLLRKLKLSGISSRVGHESVTIDTKPGKRSGSLGGEGKLSKDRGAKVVNTLSVSQQQKLAKSLEPQRPGITNGVRAPTIHSECIARSENGAQLSVGNRDAWNGAALEGHGTKKSSSKWLFKWKWGVKPAAKVAVATVQRGANPYAAKADEPRMLSPTAEIMSDARDAFYTSKSDRYSSGVVNSDKKSTGHRRGASWGCASLAATAAITPIRSSQRNYSRIHQDDNDAGNTIESRVGSMDRDLSQSFRNGESFRSTGGQSFRSTGGQSFRKGELVFEDCHGSFRSIASGGSCASFRSVEEIEWDSRLPPPLPADQNLTIGDVAALCNSSLKFVFKCREIHHFNKFLRSQKSLLLNGCSEKGGPDCFNVILSGTDIGMFLSSAPGMITDARVFLWRTLMNCSVVCELAEVSSMVAAMAYAWFLENTVPKVTGETWHAVPMIDMPRHQMHKHKSAAWLFDACGIDPAAMLYADEIELGSLIAAGRVKTSIIGQDVLVTRNEVGSVCTLLGEKLVAEAQCLLEPRYMKTLLLAGILLDTENLDFASMRDTEMTTTLLVGSGSLGRNGFFDQLREVEDDDRVSKFISRNYGDGKQLSGRKSGSAALKSKIQQEAEQEQSDKDSLFTQSQDHTSTSEAGTNSSLEEDSPRLKQRSSFKYTKLPPNSAPARSHQLPSPSSAGCNEDGKAVAHIRRAATQSAKSKLPSGGNSSPNFTRIRKKLFLYQA